MSGAVQVAGGIMAYDRGHGVTSDAESVVLSEAEQALSDEFLEKVRTGARPDIEQYLSRLPGSETRLRPILEGALLFGDEVERFKREHPDTSIFEWLCKGKGEGSRE
jgi:hypothetical protein